jgi:ribosomal protein L22
VADKDDQQSPGSKGPKADEAKVETEAAEAKAEAAAEQGEAPEAEEKPKPKRRSRAKKKPDTAKAEKAKEEAAAEEAEAEAAEADGEPAEEDAKAKPKTTARRRRGGEAVAGRTQQPKRKPRGDVDPNLTVRARARYVRHAPRKARLVIDHIRGKDVAQARAILMHTPRAASRDVLKLLDSAIANAENNHDLVADDLKVGKAYVDEGPTLKRYRPRALGRATRIRKRTSHMTIELVSKG